MKIIPDGPQIKFPQHLHQELIQTTTNFLDTLVDWDPQKQRYTKRAGAPSVVAVMDRSGTQAASGILAWADKQKVPGIEFVTLSHIGHELEAECGPPYFEDFPEETDQPHHNNFRKTFRRLAHTRRHPVHAEVGKLADKLKPLTTGQHEVRIFDDVIEFGMITEIIGPELVKLAAHKAGFQPNQLNIHFPLTRDLVQAHFIEELPHRNDFSPFNCAAIRPVQRITYYPHRSIAMFPHLHHWQTEVVDATFGSGLTIMQRGYLNERLRGPSDLPATINTRDIAFSRGIAGRDIIPPQVVRTFTENPIQTVGTLLKHQGVHPHQVADYLDSLPRQLTKTITQITNDHMPQIEQTIQARSTKNR